MRDRCVPELAVRVLNSVVCGGDGYGSLFASRTNIWYISSSHKSKALVWLIKFQGLHRKVDIFIS